MSGSSYVLLRQPYTDSLKSYNLGISPDLYFYIFLAVAQDMGVDFLPITHQLALPELGKGVTGDVRQNFVNPEYSLAFKPTQNIAITLNEMIAYAHQPLRRHPNVVRLEGISWDVSETGGVAPNLVFEKSSYGDCETFMRSAEGQQLEIEDRLSCCLQIAKALDETHRAHIIHADIKPENILVYKEESAKWIAKLSDFGFSSYVPFPEGEQLVYMPQSVPWTAPEYHHHGFTFYQAVKMDIYSFGLFALWFLTKDVDEPKIYIFGNDGVNDDPRATTGLGKRLLSTKVPRGSILETRLGQLVDLSLAYNPDQRVGSMFEIIRALDPQCALTSLVSEAPTSRREESLEARLLTTSRFNISSAMLQLFEVDIQVRRSIHTCLQNLILDAQRNANPELYEELAFQLAFCYRMGFGVGKDEDECRKWLLESKRHQSDLEHQIQLIKSSNFGRRFHESLQFGLWFGKGHIPMLGDVQYFRERNRLTDIFSTQEDEISDWKIVLGSTHWVVLAREEHYFHILLSLGYWDKAEALVRGTLRNVEESLPSDDLHVIRAESNVAMACLCQRKTDDAERLIKEVLRKSDKVSISDQTARLVHEDILASVYTAKGELAKAIDLRSEVYKELSAMLGENHISALKVLWNLREDYFRRRYINRAASLSRKLLETATIALGEDHEVTILAKIGSAEIDWSRRWFWGYVGPRRKIDLNLDLIRSSQRILGDEHSTTLQLMSHTAKDLLSKTRFLEAIAFGEQIVELSARRFGADHPDTVTRQKQLKTSKAIHGWYLRFERIGTIRLGKFAITPSFGVRSGLERVWGPIYKKTDTQPISPFLSDAGMAAGENNDNGG